MICQFFHCLQASAVLKFCVLKGLSPTEINTNMVSMLKNLLLHFICGRTSVDMDHVVGDQKLQKP